MKSILLTLLASLALQGGLIAQSTYPQLAPPGKGQVQTHSSTSAMSTDDPYATFKTHALLANQKIERTLSILKPDALKNRHVGEIISRFEEANLRVAAIKMIQLTPGQAAQFYNVHRERSFFPELIQFMSSGPVIVVLLEGANAINKNRELMGATNPKNAAKGTIRADFAESVSQNAVHGSDSPETARQEIAFFFKDDEIFASY